MINHPAYDYHNRTALLTISWDDFHSLCRKLAHAAAEDYPEMIVAIGRGGYYPGTLIAHMLRIEVEPVRITRRVDDQVVYQHPVWVTPPSAAVASKRILVVDEISSTGETLDLVRQEVLAKGARQVKCAVLYAHTRSANIPDYVGLVSDALIINPWDREIFLNGRFQIHPEYAAALHSLGIESDGSLFLSPGRFDPPNNG